MSDLEKMISITAMDAVGVKPLSRSPKSKKKRDAIMRAAITIINEKSYALATMSEIAASLDLRDATLYYYFSSKRTLAYACHVRSLERFEHFLAEAEEADLSGAAKLEQVIHSLLHESNQFGPLLYFGDYSYLDTTQRKSIASLASRLTVRLEQFLKDGISDGSVVQCETGLVVNLLLGTLIWLGKWTPSVENLTVDRLMDAIRAFSLHGLESRV
jgi:AcrR family transcriptional regulator